MGTRLVSLSPNLSATPGDGLLRRAGASGLEVERTSPVDRRDRRCSGPDATDPLHRQEPSSARGRSRGEHPSSRDCSRRPRPYGSCACATVQTLGGRYEADVVMNAAFHQTSLHDDYNLGYQTIRSILPSNAVHPTLQAFKPDVVVVTCGDSAFAAESLSATREVPSVLYVRAAAGANAVTTGAHCDVTVANSRFVPGLSANSAARQCSCLLSFLEHEYDIASTREKVLFVNPTAGKGVGIALAFLGSRPDIPFVFSLSWRMKASALRNLSTARRLPNVKIRDSTIEPSMLFRDCRLVLVPTQVPGSLVPGRLRGADQWATERRELARRAAGISWPRRHPRHPPSSTQAWSRRWLPSGTTTTDMKSCRRRRWITVIGPRSRVDSVVQHFERLVTHAIDRHSRCGFDSPV